MTEPETEAGRRRLAWHPSHYDRCRYHVRGECDCGLLTDILAIEQEARADFDVERLARALLRAVPGYERWLLPPPNSRREAAARIDAMNAEVRVHAAAIAAAYRED